MSTEEVIPAEGADRRLLPPEGLEADRRHPPLAGGQHRARVRDPVGPVPRFAGSARPATVATVTRIPRAGALAAGRRILAVDGKPGYAPGLAPNRGSSAWSRCGRRSRSHRCEAAVRQAAARATTPVKLTLLRDGIGGRSRCSRVRQLQQRLLIASASAPEGRRRSSRCRDAERHRDVNVTTVTVESIVRCSSRASGKESLRLVGSYEATRQSFEFDTVRAVSVLALISLSLGIINLFPFLPLDGGHIFWALAEKIRGLRDLLPWSERPPRRLPARVLPVLRRALQRHRTVDERGRLRVRLDRFSTRRRSKHPVAPAPTSARNCSSFRRSRAAIPARTSSSVAADDGAARAPPASSARARARSCRPRPCRPAPHRHPRHVHAPVVAFAPVQDLEAPRRRGHAATPTEHRAALAGDERDEDVTDGVPSLRRR